MFNTGDSVRYREGAAGFYGPPDRRGQIAIVEHCFMSDKEDLSRISVVWQDGSRHPRELALLFELA